ncbi:MAG: DMT family transporter [Firmicutes bacterium]|nr:DMT family transporter [Bacillota bacterium]
MIYLVLAIVSSACVSIFMRLSEHYIKSEMAMFLANYGICTVLAFIFMEYTLGETLSQGGAVILGLGLTTGALYLGGFMLLKYNMKHNGIVLSSTFMKLGVLIPTLMAVVIFGEMPEALQILGIILALAAIVVIQFEKESIKEGNKKLWLLLVLIGSGMADAMSNIYEQVGPPGGKDGFLLITFGTALLLTCAIMLIGKMQFGKADLLFGMLIGIPNYFSARFLLLALGSVDAVIAYPVYSVATLITITLVGLLCFHEKLSRKKAVALVMIVAALCLLNM